jgi:nucleotide-binding universal stress UspA family protein
MTRTSNQIKTIVVGVDGSDHGRHALELAIALARPLHAEIVATFAFRPPSHTFDAYGFTTPLLFEDDWHRELVHTFEQDWCAPLRNSGVRFKTRVVEGRPASAISELAERVHADLIVVGRRGRGGFAELLLGSVSQELTHHSRRPVLVVSPDPESTTVEP